MGEQDLRECINLIKLDHRKIISNQPPLQVYCKLRNRGRRGQWYGRCRIVLLGPRNGRLRHRKVG